MYPSVRAIGQDGTGYLWMGTRAGLARFDGITLAPLSDKIVAKLPNPFVQHLATSDDGALWAATNSGLLCYRRGSWTRIDSTFSSQITGMLAVPGEPLLVVADAKLFRVRNDKFEHVPVTGAPIGVVRGMARTSRGEIVICGVPTLIISDGQARRLGRSEGLLHDSSTAVETDEQGGLWIGTAEGLNYIRDGEVASFTARDGLPVNAIRSLLVDRNGNLWIGTSSGLTRRSGNRFENLVVGGDEHVSHVLSLFEDREHNVWLGTDSGFARLTDVALTHIGLSHGLPTDSASAVVHAPSGTTWIATMGGGLTKFTAGSATGTPVKPGLPNDTIIAMSPDRAGGIWLGYSSSGIAYLGGDGSITRYLDNAATGPAPSIVEAQENGTVWATDRRQLLRFDGNRFLPLDIPGLRTPSALASEGQDTLWVAGSNGVGRFSSGKWQFIAKAPSDASIENRAIAVITDPDEGVWVLREPGELHRHSARESGVVRFDVRDVGPLGYGGARRGRELWLNMRFGVLRVSVDELTAVLRGEKASPEYVIYNQGSGMKSLAPNLAGFPAVTVDGKGRVWSTTSRGVVVIDPTKIPFNTHEPIPVLERVTTDKVERPFSILDRIPPGRGELAFAFTAPSLTEPSRVRFKYRLVGFDPEWVGPTADRAAFYGGLPPGRYRFEVLAANNDGLWSKEAATINLRILPFFYQRIEYQLLAALLLIGTIFGIVRWRVHRLHQHASELKRQNALLEDRVAERTVELERSYEALRASQRELMEASRHAGIAEMATGVLHNIGNALNSVTTSVGLAVASVQRMRPDGVTRVVRLMRDQGSQIGEFLLHDERGRRVPEYIERAAENLEQQRTQAMEELSSLERAVASVSEIVATQQSLAGPANVREMVSPSELVESAIRLTELVQMRNHATVRREFSPVPDILLDQHKALQVLTGLLRNALIAVQELDENEREIVVNLREAGPGAIVFSISHPGCGFTADQIPTIFSGGYAKDASQYGYGLHAHAFAAKDMGGTLTLVSDGPGHGATFILELRS